MLKIIRRVFSFADWSATHPAQPHPGDMIDAQFDEIIDRIDGWDDRVRRAITEDGRIAYGAIDNQSVIPQIAEAVYSEASTRIRKQVDAVDRAEKAAKISKDAAEAALIRAEQLQAQAEILSDQLQPAQAAALAETDRLLRLAREALAKAEKLSFDELNAANRADEANNNALLWAEVSQDWAEHMPDTIPPNTLAWMGISGEHWSARWWANRADNAFGRLTDLYLGVHPTPPATNLEGGPIQPGSIYFDNDPLPGQMYVWNGSTWESMGQPQRAAVMTLWYYGAAGQTVFPLNTPDINGKTFTLNQTKPEPVDAHVNGVKLMQKTTADGDFTVNPTTSTITLLRPMRLGDIIAFDLFMPNTMLGPGAVNAWVLKPLTGKDGVKVTFALETVAGTPIVTVVKTEELIVSLDGAIQEPGIEYTASGANITFAQAPAADAKTFITWFASTGGVGAGLVGPIGPAGPPGPAGPAGSGGSSAWADITGKPSTFPPTAHTHPVAEVIGLGTAATRNIHVGTTAPPSPAVNDIWVDIS